MDQAWKAGLEDVIAARVHQLVPPRVWKGRFEQINDFERLLTANDAIVLKFFLHVSREEQLRRFHERETDPLKAWKVSAADWRERERWDDYERAYEDALSACSTKDAPWYVVPADHKWFTRLIVAEVLAATLLDPDPQYPTISEAQRAELADAHGALEAS